MPNKFQLLIMIVMTAIISIYIQPVIAGEVYDVEDSFNHGSPAGVSSVIAPATRRGKFGYIDKTGKMIIPAEFEEASNFNNGYADITKDGQSALIDKSGKYVTPFFSSSEEMSNNAIYKTFETSEKRNTSNYCIDPDEVRSKYSTYSVDGKTYELLKQHQKYCFYEGRARVRFIGHFYKVREFRTGFINKEKQMVIKPVYSYADNFSEGLTVVTLPGRSNEYGYIDLDGNVVIPFKYYNAKEFKDGKAIVSVFNKEGRSTFDCYLMGVIDKQDNYLVKPQYTKLKEFSEGLAVAKKDGKYGYIDETGNIIIDFKFLDASSFSEGLAKVKIAD